VHEGCDDEAIDSFCRIAGSAWRGAAPAGWGARGGSNREFTQLDQRLGVVENRALEKKRDSWCVCHNFDHYLYEIDKAAGRGVGRFGRFGASDGNPNHMQYVYRAGVRGPAG